MSKPITDIEIVRELRKEIGFRHSVYPRLVASGKMTFEESQRRISILEAVQKEYESHLPQQALLRL